MLHEFNYEMGNCCLDRLFTQLLNSIRIQENQLKLSTNLIKHRS